jgi:hypothetical protein
MVTWGVNTLVPVQPFLWIVLGIVAIARFKFGA